MSWTMIFQRGLFLKNAKVEMVSFEDMFWSGMDLSKLYTELSTKGEAVQGLSSIFFGWI